MPTPFAQGDFADRLTDAEVETFWRKVAEAYALVSTDHDKSVNFRYTDKLVQVDAIADPEADTPTYDIRIWIYDAQPEPPTLISP